MRRALSKLVPAEIFARKRKGFVARHPLAMVESALSTLEHLLQAPIVVSLGWIDGETLSGALFAAKHGRLDHMSPLLGTLRLELWLQTLVDQKLLTAAATRQRPEGEEACAQGKVVLTQ